ncbi:pectate lyase [Priestia sp. FSL H7-0729]
MNKPPYVDEDVPFYADRDGLKYLNILDISEERRHGYSWAGSYDRTLLKLASIKVITC